MKYGQTLRQRSIPSWSHHNIDYDDIKHFIKEQTTPGKGKTVAIPGRSDEKLQNFENSLLAVLKEQHHRIDLFVKSKAGEIQRRLDHSKRQLQQLSARGAPAAEQRIPVGRLERYGKLENDILKAGDEVRSLARFTSTQRTAFRKLLKKYKKWTGSTQLEDRFRAEVLDDPKSFTKLDLGSLLDDYSVTLQQIRTLYENRVQLQPTSRTPPQVKPSHEISIITRLQSAIKTGSKTEFDTAIASIPLGESGTFASYFVHPENTVELQVLLLQHSRYLLSRSRSNSVTTPVSSSSQNETFSTGETDSSDYFALEADNAERFAEESNRATVAEREHCPGSTPQKARVCVRWNTDEEAQVAFRPRSNTCQYARLKKKFVLPLMDNDAPFSSRKAAATAEHEPLIALVRRGLEQDRSLQPLYVYSSCRDRFVGTNNNNQRLLVATLDTHISIQTVENGATDSNKSRFPFAVLLVRQEGAVAGGLLAALDQSHLVERIPGFSFEYHAIWETFKSPKIPPPFWLPTLERDIRKLPPPAMKRTPSSASRTPNSTSSGNGVTDSTTAVETARSDSTAQPSELEAPPIRAFRKKRRSKLPTEALRQETERYWSEYDHPEDDDTNNAYFIYIDPNQTSAIDALFGRLSRLFGKQRKLENEALLTEPTSPKDSETSDDDDEVVATKPRDRSYGTLLHAHRTVSGPRGAADLEAQKHTQAPSASQLTSICYVASLVILAVAYILAATGKRKLQYQVDFGVIFAISSSLFFAIAGFAFLLRRPDISYSAWLVGITVLVIDAVGSGGLLAWILG